MLVKDAISISGHKIGRIMHQNMGFEITVAPKITERKNTTLMILDLIKRDCDNKIHKQMIRASDVTYIAGA